MMSEVEERPRLITASYGRHRSQWVNEEGSLLQALAVLIERVEKTLS